MHPLLFPKRVLCVVFVLSLIYLPSIAQNKNIDSLKRLISTRSAAKTSFDNDTTLVKAQYLLSREYIFTGEYFKADSLANLVLVFSKAKSNYYKEPQKLFFIRQQAQAYTCLGIVQSSTGNQTAALEQFNASLKISQSLDDIKGISSSLGSMGNVFKEQGNFSRALESYFGALKYAEQLKADNLAAIHLANIGNAYQELGENKKSLDYYLKALRLAEKIKDQRGVAIDLGNIGRVYMYLGDYDKALEYYFKSLDMAEQLGLKMHITHTLGNIGSLYVKKKDLPKALEYMEKALVKAKEIDEKNGIARLIGGIGKVYLEQGKTKEAEENLKKSLDLALKINDLHTIQSAHQSLSRVYETTGDWKKAHSEFQLYILARDSLFNKENTKKAMRSELNFEYEKKATADSVKHLSEQKLKDAEIAVQNEQLKQARTRSYALFGGLAIVLLFTGFIINRFRVTHKQKQIIELKEKETKLQKEIIEEKHKEITDSINYAERIQRTFLASKELLDKNLGGLTSSFQDGGTALNFSSERNYFVMFKPKDIVSGDFYWASLLSDGTFALATADSTGHGVPGAIMSLLNITSLEKATEHNTDPANILNATRQTIIERLKKDGSTEGGKDGMDCSILCFDFNKRILKIAAANNPVWIVRTNKTGEETLRNSETISVSRHELKNSGTEKTVIEIKPDKIPVGKHDKDHQSFTTHTIELQRGDIIYTLTDGFPDQFGGDSGKKFMSKKLKEVLIENSHLSMQDQKNALELIFKKWIGNLEQVDDVTIIGVRV